MSDQGITVLAIDPRGYVAQRPRKKSQVVSRYVPIAVGGAAAGAVLDGISTRSLKGAGRGALVWSTILIFLNGIIDATSRLFNRY